LNETILWLLYCAGALVSFALFSRLGWRIVPSTIAGSLVTALGWIVLYLAAAEDKRPVWWRLDLSLNLSFALIFAAAGAAAAYALQYRSSREQDRLTNRD
jgi:hypothetical protein